MTLFQPPKPTV